MEKNALIFGEDCIDKNKIQINIDKGDIKRIVLSKKYLYGNKGSFKYVTGYIHIGNFFPTPLC